VVTNSLRLQRSEAVNGSEEVSVDRAS
jgi:hypothetical protein